MNKRHSKSVKPFHQKANSQVVPPPTTEIYQQQWNVNSPVENPHQFGEVDLHNAHNFGAALQPQTSTSTQNYENTAACESWPTWSPEQNNNAPLLPEGQMWNAQQQNESWNWPAGDTPNQQTWEEFSYQQQQPSEPQIWYQPQPAYYDGSYATEWQPNPELTTEQTPWHVAGENRPANCDGTNYAHERSFSNSSELITTNGNSADFAQVSYNLPNNCRYGVTEEGVSRENLVSEVQEAVPVAVMREENRESIEPGDTTKKRSERIDEPNQEIPEPVQIKDSGGEIISSSDVSQSFPFIKPSDDVPNKTCDRADVQTLGEDVPNQESPVNVSNIKESRNVVIQPREGSLFQPPAVQHANKKAVVQHESSPSESFPKVSHRPELSANLETEPDNLEKPPDLELPLRHSVLHHRHHKQTALTALDSTLLWENPDIPSVTFIPSVVQTEDSHEPSGVVAAPQNVSTAGEDKDAKNLQEDVLKEGVKESNEPSAEISEHPSRADVASTPNTQETSNHFNGERDIDRRRSYVDSNYEDKNDRRSSSGRYYDDDDRYDDRRDRRTSRHRDDRRQYYYDDDESHRRNSRPSSRMSEPMSNERKNYYRDSEGRKHYYDDRERTPSRLSESEQYRRRHRGEDYSDGKRYDDRSSRSDGKRYDDRSSHSDGKRYDYRSSHSDGKRYDDRSSHYNREQDYYQRSTGYDKGYHYGQYGHDYPSYSYYYDPYQSRYPSTRSYDYGFYDELYRMDSRYTEQMDPYRSYYGNYVDPEADLLSLHSSHSSIADELSKDGIREKYGEEFDNSSNYSGYDQRSRPFDKYNNNLDSELSGFELESTTRRLTPYKYLCAHVVARFSAGRLIKVVPNSSGVQIHDLQHILGSDDGVQELTSFPGPLVRDQTHKNDVVHFCNEKIRELSSAQDVVDRDSRVLLWELLILLLRQNGSLVGSDIAELLLKGQEAPTMAKSFSDSLNVDPEPDASPDEGIVVSLDKAVVGSSTDHVTRKFREYLLFGHKKDALEWAMRKSLWGHALFLASKMDSRTYANVMTRFANSLSLKDPLQTLYQLMSGRQPAAVTNVLDEKWGDWKPHLSMILSNPSSHSEVDQRSITTLGDTLAEKGSLCGSHFCYLMAQVDFGSFHSKSSKLVLLGSNHLETFEEFSSNRAIQCTEIYEYAQSLANPYFALPHLQPYKFLYATRLAENGFLQEALHYCEVLSNLAVRMPNLCSYWLLLQIYELGSRLKYHDACFSQGQGELEEQIDPVWLQNLSGLLHCTPPVYDTPVYEPTGPEEIPFYSGAPNDNIYSTVVDGGASRDSISKSYGEAFFPSGIVSEDVSTSVPDPSPPPVGKSLDGFDYYGFAATQKGLGRERQDSLNSIGRRSSNASTTAQSYPAPSGQSSVKHESREEPKVGAASKESIKTGRSWLGGIFGKFLPKGQNQMILPDDKNPSIVWDPVNSKWVNTDADESIGEAPPLAPPTDTELKYKDTRCKDVAPGLNKFQRPKAKAGMRQNYVDILKSSHESSAESKHSAPNDFLPVQDAAPGDLTSLPSTELPPQTSHEEQLPAMFDPAQFNVAAPVKNSRLGRRTFPR